MWAIPSYVKRTTTTKNQNKIYNAETPKNVRNDVKNNKILKMAWISVGTVRYVCAYDFSKRIFVHFSMQLP